MFSGAQGHAPSVLIKPIENPERERYEKVWQFNEYRVNAPGIKRVNDFLREAKPPEDAECIDFGCGTGRAALHLAYAGKLKVHMVDFADNCLDKEVREAIDLQNGRMTFRVHDLLRPLPFSVPYGFCSDMMEHVREEDVQTVLRNILGAAQHVFFCICTGHDHYGSAISDGPLHLTVQPREWWEEQLKQAGAVILWSDSPEELWESFYVSSWCDAGRALKEALPDGGKLNVELDTINANIAANVRAGWKHADPHDRQDREVIVLGGGPSLNDHVDEIRRLRKNGAALVTTNGTYGWALEHGMKPSMQIVVDAREFSGRFSRPVIDDCIYMMCSQVHPKTLDGLPHERTFLWHTDVTEQNKELILEHHPHCWLTPGGSTVVLRSIPLLRMLGFWRLHLFGFDSCVRRSEGAHHAYRQVENDGEPLFPVGCNDRVFWCAGWMVSQAVEFLELMEVMGSEVEMEVYGDGLIAEVIRSGARVAALAAQEAVATAEQE